MSKVYKFAVVGRGLMGSAAARHLANMTDGVVAIGPSEPQDRKAHHGVFASHYDEGRITRTIDPDPVWAMLAKNSIARYREIETATGISFYGEVGSLLTGPGVGAQRAYIADTRAAAIKADVPTLDLDGAGLRDKFPWFNFPDGTAGVFEPKGAGYISPRRLVGAQSALAERAGAEIIDSAVESVRQQGGHCIIATASGDELHAETVLVAAGGFSIQKSLLPRPVEMKVYARTVVFFEVSEADAQAMAAMPSMINKAERDADDTYMLPPIRYPDGRWYLKIGGEPDDLALDGEALGDWFRSEGRPSAIAHLKARMASLVPGLKPISITSAPCITSYTASGYPAIGWLYPGRIAVVTGGCGAAAKSSDEIGRLGAELVYEGRISSNPDAALFTPVFAA